MAKLYVTYAYKSPHGQSIAQGRSVVRVVPRDPDQKLTMEEVEDIEARVLVSVRITEPAVRDLFLTNWIWLRDE